MNTEKGLVSVAWASLREAWFSDLASRLVIIDYNRLVADPAAIVAKLYASLAEPAFVHDFEHLSFDEPDYDEALGMPGLPRVAVPTRAPCIPPDILAKYADASFWKRPEANTSGAAIL